MRIVAGLSGVVAHLVLRNVPIGIDMVAPVTHYANPGADVVGIHDAVGVENDLAGMSIDQILPASHRRIRPEEHPPAQIIVPFPGKHNQFRFVWFSLTKECRQMLHRALCSRLGCQHRRHVDVDIRFVPAVDRLEIAISRKMRQKHPANDPDVLVVLIETDMCHAELIIVYALDLELFARLYHLVSALVGFKERNRCGHFLTGRN